MIWVSAKRDYYDPTLVSSSQASSSLTLDQICIAVLDFYEIENVDEYRPEDWRWFVLELAARVARAGERSARLSHGIFAAIGQFQLFATALARSNPPRPSAPRSYCRPKYHDVVALGGGSFAIGRPIGDQPSTLLHHIAASISTFDLAPDGVGKRHFAKLARIRGLLRRPIAERRSEAVDGRAHAAHSAHELQHAHSREGPTRPCAKHEAASAGISESTRAERSESGGRCSFPAFILSAGTVHTFASRSNSSQRAPTTSAVRAAVRI